MKKKKCIFLITCLWALALFGCRSTPRVQCRYVTAVDITCDHGDAPIRRHYTDTEKMEAVLIYLRLLQPGGAPAKDPDAVDADVYEITVSLSDGHHRVYQQKDHRFFRNLTGGWQTVSPGHCHGLYTLMRNYESDL